MLWNSLSNLPGIWCTRYGKIQSHHSSTESALLLRMNFYCTCILEGSATWLDTAYVPGAAILRVASATVKAFSEVSDTDGLSI